MLAKFEPETEKFFVMDMLDHSAYQTRQTLSLDKIATEFYGRTYIAQQTGDKYKDDKYKDGRDGFSDGFPNGDNHS